MKPRGCVLSQIQHQETRPIPFSLHWEDEVGDRLDAYYGGPEWRESIPRYLANVGGAVDTVPMVEPVSGLKKDIYGTVKRFDKLPFHVVEYPAESSLSQELPFSQSSETGER
jgi:hypothetical protein